MGLKGSGKTKSLIEMVNSAIVTEKGSIICIECGKNLTFDINYKARLIDISTFSVDSFAMLRGFICGLYAGNYDISHIFIDHLFRVSGVKSIQEADHFLQWLQKFGNENGIDFTVTLSAHAEDATPAMKALL